MIFRLDFGGLLADLSCQFSFVFVFLCRLSLLCRGYGVYIESRPAGACLLLVREGEERDSEDAPSRRAHTEGRKTKMTKSSPKDHKSREGNRVSALMQGGEAVLLPTRMKFLGREAKRYTPPTASRSFVLGCVP